MGVRVTEGAMDVSAPATGVKPGALSALLQEVAAAPEPHEAELPSLPPGAVIGRFEILRELGRGGFGVVYEARDQDLGRQVALKFVRPGRATDEEGKVVREADAIARLAHPNLITLHDVGRSHWGPYLVFEFLRGKTLQERMDDGLIPVQEAVHVATEVARGLAHAHGEGVVHRDLKPSNVFVTNNGQVKILDFGLAHAFGRRRVSGGTPAYMAPEQWEDDPEDERTDVFALGVLLYRMLSGDHPYPEGQGRWSSERGRVRKLDVPGAPGLAELVDRMLDQAPKGRPRDGASVLASLTPIEEALRSRPADGTPPIHVAKRKGTPGDLLASLKRGTSFLPAIAAAVALLAIAGAGGWYAQNWGIGRRPASAVDGAVPSVAVLPFADLSPGHDHGYFSDGIAEEILNGLAQVEGLRVIGRTSSFSYKGRKLEEIGRELGVKAVLDGSVRRSGDRVRIAAQLVQVPDGTQLWTQTFDRDLSDVFAVQGEIARAVVDALRVRLLTGRTVNRSGGTTNPEALRQYLLGRDLSRAGTSDGVKESLGAFEKAVTLDPGFAQAWVAVSDAASSIEDVHVPSDGDTYPARRRRAISAAERAVDLAPDLPEGWVARARVRSSYLHDWQGARADLERARALAPGDANVVRSYGDLLVSMGDVAGGVVELDRAASIDPRSYLSWEGLVVGRTSAGDLEGARAARARALEILPKGDIARWFGIVAELTAGGEAAVALTLAREAELGWVHLAGESLAQHDLGNPRESQAALDELIRRFPNNAAYQVAEIHARRGETDLAFEWLERAIVDADCGLSWTKTDPLLVKIRSDPRYAALLRKMNLPVD
jgi:TolB-like protein/tetratricopeptide (TPR) repeat protein